MSKIIDGHWTYPTNMIVGPGTLAQLPGACAALGMKRPLLVTDVGLKDLPMVQNALAQVPQCGLFADVQGNPVAENVDAGVKAFHQGAHDGIIAFGGGSALDVGKAIALMVGQDRPLWDFEGIEDHWTRVNVAGVAPVVAVPTTAGTGSEVGRASVITNAETSEKKIIFHPSMMPATVISDPELTLSLPPHITAATGIDAFVHCFEALCAPGYHPMAEGIALEGMRLISEALPKAYADGNNVQARADMLVAASMGATAFQKGLGGVHALAHAIGGLFNVHHGLTNAVLLPYVMLANQDAIQEASERTARILALSNPTFESLLAWVLSFRKSLGIPETLLDLGLAESDAKRVGERAHKDPCASGNPLPFDAQDYEAIYRRAFKCL
ncbi:MAG: iron-containing alcohol dehydrogenase [Magnetovibrio sp.]|nr:iron-containing alcohol dehydrogenase [Magnetovibrio sp.]